MELLLYLFGEFSLFIGDFKHRKRITKMEKDDGVKRPFQKYFFRPSTIVLVMVLVIVGLSCLLFSTYYRVSIYSEKTELELSEMSDWINKCNKKQGRYPKGLKEVIGNNPIRRQQWNTDAWSHPYKYAVINNGKEFLLISSGPDGQFETEDDIKVE